MPEGYRLEVFTAGLNYVSDITEANARLTYHGGLDATSIQVKVEGGEITLGGTVDNRRTTRLAEDALERVSGVKGTHNQLRQQAQDKA
ncbi:MAG: BON domain-containing protein [Deinococcota bacterium]|nr:BON domain-containing protein [Deinococcota bacterium]